ncbi:MAG: hypothetical protein ACI8WB_003975, partial [Phenylobacterium sp.]
ESNRFVLYLHLFFLLYYISFKMLLCILLELEGFVQGKKMRVKSDKLFLQTNHF